MVLSINYENINVHKMMLRDRMRCEAFCNALRETIKPGDIVLDIGAGTGILSLFSAKAGAKKVYAVERTNIAQLAKKIISDNNLEKHIEVLQDDMESLTLPEKVDVIVSEWLGGYGVDENLLPIIIEARDRWLKPEGTLIPSHVSSWIVPVWDKNMDEDISFWNAHPYGINLSSIGTATASQFHCCRNDVKEEDCLTEAQQMWEIDVYSYPFEKVKGSFSAHLEFQAMRDEKFNGLAAWFYAQLSSKIAVTNAPSAPDTHWGRWIFPIGESISIKNGAKIDVEFSPKPMRNGSSKVYWKVKTGEYKYKSEDTTKLI